MLIPFKELLPRYNINPTGIVQCGANTGQEMPIYWDLGIKRMVMIEAIPDVYEKLVENAKQYEPNVICINTCLSDKDGENVVFNIANNEGQSSSMLEFGTHTTEHKEVQFIDAIILKTERLDTVLAAHEIDVEKYDMLVCDLQGAELLALKGLGDMLHKFNYLYLEVNVKHLYKDCPLVGEIDDYVAKYGFYGVEERILSFGWGDKLYKKR